MKMALGYWRNLGEPRHRIVALEHGYHGDTIGTMSAGARGVFNAAYEPLLFDVVRIPFPHAGREEATIDALDFACRSEPVAALVVEPLILGAGGMLTYPATVLAEMKRVCEVHGALFIADEVMTGWGRTGTLFACEQAGITPDILCTAKGLTGGSLPLAATLCVPKIFEAHLSEDRAKTFFHSSSFTANPICCAAALANIGVWETEPVRERIAALTALQAERLAPFVEDRRFTGVRQRGHHHRARSRGRRRRLSCRRRPQASGVLPRARPAPAPARQHDLRHAALLRHRPRAGSRLRGNLRRRRRNGLNRADEGYFRHST